MDIYFEQFVNKFRYKFTIFKNFGNITKKINIKKQVLDPFPIMVNENSYIFNDLIELLKNCTRYFNKHIK